jgi:hypothetical protein
MPYVKQVWPDATRADSMGARLNNIETGIYNAQVTGDGAIPNVVGAVSASRLATNEAWHVVGATGEPAFQNAWANYSGGYTVARFKKDKENTVFIEGLVASGTAATIFTLPTGYTPTGGSIIMATQTNANTIGRLEIGSSGTVLMAIGSNVWFSICCSFKAE